MTESVFYKNLFYLFLAGMIFATVVILTVSVLRFFFTPLYDEVLALYNEYFGTTISLSLVLDGK